MVFGLAIQEGGLVALLRLLLFGVGMYVYWDHLAFFSFFMPFFFFILLLLLFMMEEGQRCYCYLLGGRINTDSLRADEWSG